MNEIVPEKERVIMKNGCAVLTPRQFYRLLDNLDPNIGYRMIVLALMNTGLRVVEFWKLVDNREWYHASARVIDLPKEGTAKKIKSHRKERTVRLTVGGCKSLETVYNCGLKFRERDAMGGALKRAAVKAGFGGKGIMPKMFRKMLGSWLVECRRDLDIDSLDVTSHMGHDEKTLRDNYLGIGFEKRDHDDMVVFLKGWRGD